MVVALFGALAWMGATGLGQESAMPSPSAEGLLLLRNGNLLQGEITETGDGYRVVVVGGEIHVKASEVEFRCRTLEEGYQRKTTLIPPGDARAHLDLAMWCQRYGLIERAAEELARASDLEPGHPLIPLVERRIKMSFCPPVPTERPTEPRRLSPPPEELDRVVRDLPPGCVEEFTQAIQPLLVNRCSASGCHGPGNDNAFRLLRLPAARPASRRLTQRNLHSTLQWVDRDAPDRSKLLTVPIRAHGSAESAVFADEDRDQYQRIVDWVYQVSQKATPMNPRVAEKEQDFSPHVPLPSPTAAAAHTASVPPAGDAGSKVVPAVPLSSDSYSASWPNAGALGLGVGSHPLVRSPMVTDGKNLPQVAPVDPFDPEIFNQRFFPERRATPQSARPTWDQLHEEGKMAGVPGRLPGGALTDKPAPPRDRSNSQVYLP
jgi:hypothetical protein